MWSYRNCHFWSETTSKSDGNAGIVVEIATATQRKIVTKDTDKAEALHVQLLSFLLNINALCKWCKVQIYNKEFWL